MQQDIANSKYDKRCKRRLGAFENGVWQRRVVLLEHKIIKERKMGKLVSLSLIIPCKSVEF